ncbi:aminotransferase class IV [Guyparkeria hydrothermalis]|uniref:aminotransferase class IV n=1 Tax=Guyparkeria hydrothermalis TaxID=923 RepID=UPI002021BCA3|nr:aminotransferase class IV [Guyparkeria hydrothermalis]MCL7745255.1 aminotransferase class IV [Guyparkeria hydrothermalis]
MSPTPQAVYLNGEWCTSDSACVSVFDRGYLFGDGVYEVIPAFAGRLFGLDEHMARLSRSLEALGIVPPLKHDDWLAIFERLLASTDAPDAAIYLQVTRGAPAKRDHAWPDASVRPGVMATVSPIGAIDGGARVITLPDERWGRCDIKSINLLPNTMARQQAVEQGCDEAVLVRDGLVMEGAATNLFAVVGGRLLTAPNGPRILPGITRGLLLDLVRRKRLMELDESFISIGALREADEVFLTSSTKDIWPVVEIDGEPVGAGEHAGRAGPITRLLDRHFQALKTRRSDP